MTLAFEAALRLGSRSGCRPQRRKVLGSAAEAATMRAAEALAQAEAAEAAAAAAEEEEEEEAAVAVDLPRLST